MDDLISRQAAIEELECVGYDFSESGLSEPELEELCEAIGEVEQDMIMRIRRLTSAQQKGKWIKVKTISGDIEAYMCPFCKNGDWDILVDSYNYCPYCGKPVSGVADDPSHPFEDDVMAKGVSNDIP